MDDEWVRDLEYLASLEVRARIRSGYYASGNSKISVSARSAAGRGRGRSKSLSINYSRIRPVQMERLNQERSGRLTVKTGRNRQGERAWRDGVSECRP